MAEEKITASQLDNFSANILINLALINAAAIAAILSSDTSSTYPATPYALGLISAIISQVLWFSESAFEYIYGEPKDKLNEIIGAWMGSLILFFGCLSAGSIIYGCLCLIGLAKCFSFLLSLFICTIPFATLLYKAAREGDVPKE